MYYDGKYKYEVIFQDEYNNLYQLGYYNTLEEAQKDINEEIKGYLLDGDAYDNDDILSMECRFGKDTVLGTLKEYPSTFGACFDKEIYTGEGLIYIRGFIFK